MDISVRKRRQLLHTITRLRERYGVKRCDAYSIIQRAEILFETGKALVLEDKDDTVIFSICDTIDSRRVFLTFAYDQATQTIASALPHNVRWKKQVV